MDANRISVPRRTLQRLLMSLLLVAVAGSGFAALPPPPPPPYPPGGPEDRDARIVVLIVDLSADGTVTAVALEKSSGFTELDAAAIAAASNWHFNALLKDGKPVAGKARVPVSFPPG